MQLAEMNDGIYDALIDLWDQEYYRLPDVMRDPDVMHNFIWGGAETKLYLVGEKPAVVVIGSIEPGLSASVMLVNFEAAEVGELLRELRLIIEEFDLKRLTATVPGPAKEIHRILEKIGFRREGHLRRSTFFNGRLCGTDIFGLYREPAYESRRPNAKTRVSESTPRATVQKPDLPAPAPAQPEIPAQEPAHPAA